MEKPKKGTPGYPPATQWKLDNCHVQRLHKAQHLLYREATGKGMSGSPLYYIESFGKKAYVLGVHVGGSRFLANSAVAISHHMTTHQDWSNVAPIGK